LLKIIKDLITLSVSLSTLGLLVPVLASDQTSSNIETLYVLGLPNIDAPNLLPPEAIVIDRERLSEFGSTSLAAVLERVANISINQNAGRGSFNSVFLRGGDPNFTQIRIDGVIVNNETNTRGGAFDIGSISAQIIDRIEIISDASSAIYGSQALAGVINIVTRNSTNAGSIEIDSKGGEVASAFISTKNISLSAVVERPGNIVDGSNYESDELGLKSNWQWNDRHKLQLVGRYQDSTSEAFADDSSGSLFAASDELELRENQTTHLAGHYEYLNRSGDLFEFNASYFSQEEDRFSPAVAPGLRDPFGLPATIEQTDYRRTNIEARYTKRFNDSIRWRSAVSWQEERGQQSGELDFSFFSLPTNFDLTRTSVSVTQALEFSLSRQIKAVVSARFDDTDSDSSISPRFSISYAFDNNKQLLFANLGEGFKQASIFALADSLVGNPELLDETAKSIQIGHHYQKGNWALKHTAYFYDYKNLIDFEPGPPPSLVNRDSVQIQGLESNISYTQKNWSIESFQTYNSNDIEGSDQGLLQRPRYRAGVQANLNVNQNLSLWLKSLYVDERFDSSIPTADVTLSSYSVSDIGLGWQINDHFKLIAQWKNIFSERYSISIGNEINSDTVFLQLSFQRK